MTLRAVVLIGGHGSNLQAIIDAIGQQKLELQLQAVISHRKEAYGLQRAAKANIPCFTIEHKDYPQREAFDAQLALKIDEFNPDFIILAGFMRILTPDFIKHFAGKILNIHPSLLPKYKGLDTHQRVLDAKEAYHGASVHLVTEDLDDGPVLGQAQIAIEENDTAESLKRKVQEIEHVLYPAVLQNYILQKKQMPFDDTQHINNIDIHFASLEDIAL